MIWDSVSSRIKLETILRLVAIHDSFETLHLFRIGGEVQ